MSAFVRRSFVLVLLAGAVGASLALPTIFFGAAPDGGRIALPAFPVTAGRLYVSLPTPAKAKAGPALTLRHAVAPRLAPLAAPAVQPRAHAVAAVPVAVVTPAAPVVALTPPPAPVAPPVATTPTTPTPAAAPVAAAPVDQPVAKVIASTPDVPVPPAVDPAGRVKDGNGKDSGKGDGNGKAKGQSGESAQGGKQDNGHGKGR